MRTRSRSLFAGHRAQRLALVGVLLALPLACQNSEVKARDAWVRVPSPSKAQTALYMVLENRGSRPISVIGASSPAADKVEMHQMTMIHTDHNAGQMHMAAGAGQTMMVMGPVRIIAIPSKGATALAPGGLHMMLFGLKTKLAAGDRISILLKLDNGTTLPVSATVRN
jgi:periplasmic copper chaperone A